MNYINTIKIYSLAKESRIPDSEIHHILRLHGNDNRLQRCSYLVDRSGTTESLLSTQVHQRFSIPLSGSEKFDLTWEDINCSRALEIENQSTDYRDTYFFWSGGIDSTNALVAIIKNCSEDFKKNLVIACNDDSIWENPFFYQHHVKDRFPRRINSTEFEIQTAVKDSLSITGDHLSRLCGANMFLNWSKWHPHNNSKVNDVTDLVIDFFSHMIGNRETAAWYFQIICDSIKNNHLEIERVHDWLWWVEFNWAWVSEYYYYLRSASQELDDAWLQKHNQNYRAWYGSDDFQRWAINNDIGNKYDLRHNLIKKAAREYIFEFDKNQWYYHFKSRMSSMPRSFELVGNQDIWAVSSDDRIFRKNIEHLTQETLTDLLDEIRTFDAISYPHQPV